MRDQEAPAHDDVEAWERLLVNTELMTVGEDGPSVTLAGLLLFGREPHRFLPQSGIDATSFPGTEKGYDIADRQTLRGPLTPLPDREPGLVGQALAFVRRALPPKASIDPEGRRVERPVYPEEVVREAVVNAVVHRDYLLSSSDIELSIYADRLEVVSPGRLPNGITPERMRIGIRAARNQLLKDVMRDYRYIEHVGLGVPLKIVRGMRAHNGTEVGLVEDGERFILTLHAGEH